MKKSNGRFVWPALGLMLIACPVLNMMGLRYLALAAFFAGMLVIAYAMATGQLKLFG